MSRSLRSIRPPGRQGPGRMPPAAVEALDLVVARRAAGALPGDRRAAGIGAGTELAQLRPYQIGDDVRQIDASATARTGIPHVRLQVPERVLTTWLVLDLSPSMAFGTANRLKSDVAEGVALVMAKPRRPARGADRARDVRRPGLAHDPAAGRPGRDRADPARAARGRVRRRSRRAARARRCADAHGAHRGPARVRRRHLRLPRAAQLDAPAGCAACAALRPGGGGARPARDRPPRGRSSLPRRSRERVRSSRWTRRGRRCAAGSRRRRRQEREAVATELRGLRVDHVVLSTEGDWLRELGIA